MDDDMLVGHPAFAVPGGKLLRSGGEGSRLLAMRLLPALLLATALCGVGAAGCADQEPTGASGNSPSSAAPGDIALGTLCPELHAAIDALVVSDTAAQHSFVQQLARLAAVADAPARASLADLQQAAADLEEAGRGDGFFAARDAIHPAVVGLDADCVAAGSPILHDGPH